MKPATLLVTTSCPRAILLTLRKPGETIAALVKPTIAVDDAQHERAKADEDRSDDDQQSLVAGV